MSQNYSYRTRVLSCEPCGTAVQVPPEGGTATCPRCQVPLVAPARPDTAVPRSPLMDDRQRMERLRAQDGKPLPTPAGLEQLVQNSEIPSWKMQEAKQVWAQTRKHIQQNPSDIAAAERLMSLTLALANTLAPTRDHATMRAIFEATLEAVSLPRHRQMMRGYLSRRAVMEGDLDSANAWLAGCDGMSDDLMMDTVFRMTSALIATSQKDYTAVIRILGPSLDEVPVHDSFDVFATVLRADAFEKTGNPAAGSALLERFLAAGARDVVESIAKTLPPEWNVCQQCLGTAQAAHRAHVGKKAGSTEWIGWVILVSGFVPIIILGVLAAQGQPVGMMFPFFLFPVIFGGWGLKMILGARRGRLIAAEGVHARGKVVGANATGTTINDVPVMLIHVQVEVPGKGPIRAGCKRLMPAHQASSLVGRELNVIWHPKYPSDCVLEL